MTRSCESGSAFFYIVLAIALFGMLTFALQQGSRTTAGNLTQDQARLEAREIIDYGNTIASAVQKLKLRGCLDTQIGFDNTEWRNWGGTVSMPAGHNPNTPGDECRVFSPTGGQLTARVISHNTSFTPTNNAHPTPGHSLVFPIEFEKFGTTEKDLVLIMHYIDQETCLEINKALNLSTSGNLIEDSWAGAPVFVGDYTGTARLGEESALIAGKPAGCIKWTGSGYGDSDVNFYQVLLAR